MTTGRTKISTANNTAILLMQGAGVLKVPTTKLVIYNIATGTVAGYWSIGSTGELRYLPVGVLVIDIALSDDAAIYIWRETDGSNLVDVRGHTY